MNRSKLPVILGLCGMALLVLFVAIPNSFAKIQDLTAPSVSLKSQPGDTVLWAVHQGSYKTAPAVYHELRGIAESLGLEMTRDEGTWILLNKTSIDQDRLIEVQIPVDASALRFNADIKIMAENYGLNIGGAKTVDTSRRAQVIKPAGAKMDDGYYWDVLYTELGRQGLNAVSSPIIVFSNVSQIEESCDADELSPAFALEVEGARVGFSSMLKTTEVGS